MQTTSQPSLFERPAAIASLEHVVMYALGEFQSRGHKLADRELALDRLRHAVNRACGKLGVETIPDDAVASLLRAAGANVKEIPNYFAKRPFRVTVSPALASEALTVYHQSNDKHS